MDYPPTVFVVDADGYLRRSIAEWLQDRGYRVRAFASASGFLHSYRAWMPGCLLLDAELPSEDGIAMYQRMLDEGKRLPVIFLSGRSDIALAVAAMKAGAIEFLEKPITMATLLSAIKRAMKVDAERRAEEHAFAALDARISRLTKRDRQTLELLLSGASNKAMAERLDLTERAIEMRRSALMRRLEVTSLTELLELILTHRIRAELRDAGQPGWQH